MADNSENLNKSFEETCRDNAILSSKNLEENMKIKVNKTSLIQRRKNSHFKTPGKILKPNQEGPLCCSSLRKRIISSKTRDEENDELNLSSIFMDPDLESDELGAKCIQNMETETGSIENIFENQNMSL